jgi:hypothetical protein
VVRQTGGDPSFGTKKWRGCIQAFDSYFLLATGRGLTLSSYIRFNEARLSIDVAILAFPVRRTLIRPPKPQPYKLTYARLKKATKAHHLPPNPSSAYN